MTQLLPNPAPSLTWPSRSGSPPRVPPPGSLGLSD